MSAERRETEYLDGTYHEKTVDKELSTYQWSAQRFSDLFDALPVATFTVDTGLNITEWNIAASGLYGIKPETALRSSIFDVVFKGADAFDASLKLEACLAGEVVLDWERNVLRDDGHLRTVSTRLRALTDSDLNSIGLIISDVDLTSERELRGELDQSRRFLAQVMNTVPVVVYVYDLDQRRHTFTNRSLLAFFGYDTNGKTAEGTEAVQALVHPDDWQSMNVHFEVVRNLADGEIAVHESRILHADGTWHVVQSKDSVFSRYQDGKVRTLLGCMQDVTSDRQLKNALNSQVRAVTEMMDRLQARQNELRRANSLLEELATTDAVTGVLNHRRFQHRIDAEIASGRGFALIILDVDDFKALNDEFGHVFGDDALRSVGETLMALSDPNWTVARYGGEEFAIILPGFAGSEAMRVAEGYREAIEAYPWSIRKVTGSFGVAVWDPSHSKRAIIEQADSAMYAAKAAGKNRVVIKSYDGQFSRAS